jgi:tetratricopeptide (TPR) repeat protein
MLNPKRKITKKEMRQDGLMSAYANATSWYYQYKNIIGYSVFALVVAIVAIIFYTNNRHNKNVEAATKLGNVMAIYDAASNDPRQYQIAIDGQRERGIMGLKEIVDTYGGTESGEHARLYLADAYLNLGHFDEAYKQYDNFSGGNKLLKASALAGAASCLEQKGDFKSAASSFEKAAGLVSDKSSTPDYLSSAARCYGLGGDKEKAVTLYKKLKQDYPQSPAARDADRYISQFSA